jgi:hypothetical protein
MLWSDGQKVAIVPPVSDLHWLLERQQSDIQQLELEVITPLRLLKNKKPLFRASFSELLPFFQRRVGSLLAFHAGVELTDRISQLESISRQVTTVENSLRWDDWRRLAGNQHAQDIGGLLGKISLVGSGLPELLWLLKLVSLFNAGKSAAYGSGQICLRTSC